jgi:hypothetical protein
MAELKIDEAKWAKNDALSKKDRARLGRKLKEEDKPLRERVRSSAAPPA